MMLSSLRTLFLGIGAAVLSACCANNTCDCRDSLADAIAIRFALSETATPVPGVPTGFRPQEIQVVKLLRYDIATTGTAVSYDSVTITRNAAQAGEAILLTHSTPFRVVGNRRLSSFRYVIKPLGAVSAGTLPSPEYQLTNIRLDGSYEADGCCTCYRNRSKAVQVNGRKIEAITVDNQPLTVILYK